MQTSLEQQKTVWTNRLPCNKWSSVSAPTVSCLDLQVILKENRYDDKRPAGLVRGGLVGLCFIRSLMNHSDLSTRELLFKCSWFAMMLIATGFIITKAVCELLCYILFAFLFSGVSGHTLYRLRIGIFAYMKERRLLWMDNSLHH